MSHLRDGTDYFKNIFIKTVTNFGGESLERVEFISIMEKRLFFRKIKNSYMKNVYLFLIFRGITVYYIAIILYERTHSINSV